MAIKKKFLKRPTALIVARDKSAGAATTITADAAAGANTITVASGTGIAAGKSLRLGEDEDVERVEVQGIVGTTVTLVKPLLRDHVSAEPVVEQTLYNIKGLKGAPKTNHAKESTDEFSSTQRLVWTKLPGFETFGLEVTIEGYTIPNLCIALGIPFSRIFGDGLAAATPMVLATDLNDTDSEQNVCLVVSYVLQDGTVMVEEFWGCSVDYTALSLQLAFGQAGAIPCRFVCYGAGVQRIGAITATPVATYQALKGKTFGQLSGVGLWVAAAAATAVAPAAGVADDDSLTVADASNIPDDSWIAVGTEDGLELHWVDSSAAGVLTLRTQLLRAQPIGTVVVPVTQLPFSSITRDGATFAVGGQSNPMYVGTRAMAIGTQPESAEASVTFRVQDMQLAARAYLLGIPQGNVANNQLLVTEDLNTAGILAVYVAGVLQDGTVNLLNLWGPIQDLADVGAELLSGASASRQFKALPTSGVQFVQYAA
jgi:hypothetical protein